MRLPFVGLLSALALPLSAGAAHGDCDGCGPQLCILDTGAGVYVDDRGGPLGNGVWIYEESNGEAGLQRGGASILIPGIAEICWDDSPNGPDALIL